MACESFKDKRFGTEARAQIEKCNEIIAPYLEDGMRLTLRQLYYQFVSKDLIPNTERSYKNLGKLVSDARLAGLIDWNSIEDRGRVPSRASHWSSIESVVDSALYSFRLDRWKGQPKYVELWVEKQALAGVLEPIAHKWHVTLMVNKGYSSQSAMRESAKRFENRTKQDGEGVLLYLGDHDPSGEDMVRDIADRFTMFGVAVDVQKIALTMAQIRKFNPPPNPAKITDSRAAAYIAKHGNKSWEVDALPPRELTKMIEKAIAENCDTEMLEAVKAREEEQKAKLRDAMTMAGFGDGSDDDSDDE